jgi:glycosyltransferase involved in cell wall biosynthesis
VLAQTYRNWEAVVVGDHCTDDTAERVQAINDPRVRFHNLPVRQNDPSDPYERYARKGTFAGRVGVTLSRGRWIAPLSHDDAWDPDHIATLLAVAREERAEVAYGRARQIDAEGRPSTPFGAWPPRYGQFMWQTAIYHGDLRFIQLDPVAELVSEPNDWNLARRAWDAGVRFTYVDRETVTVYTHDRVAELQAAYAALGLTLNASAMP